MASASISCPALTLLVCLPVTVTVPSKTLIRFVLFGLTRTSNCVPRTWALTEWPPTLKVAPLARCWTLTSVRPAFCSTSAVCSWPFFCSWTVLICTVVPGDMRTYEPSGNWIAACPPALVATWSPAFNASPAVAGFELTVTGWLNRIRVAGAVTAADAWTTKNQ